MTDKIDEQQDDRDTALLGMNIPEPTSPRSFAFWHNNQVAYDERHESDGDEVVRLRGEIERLRAALVKHHELLTDEPDDLCWDCGLAWDGALSSDKAS